MYRVLFLLFTILTLSCMSTLPTYYYGDGSANRYVVKPESLEYVPVKPEESSTGFYSGGEPKTVPLTKEQYTSLRALLETAIGRPEIQIADRIKTSGAITVEGKNYVLKPGSKEKEEIEGAMKKLLGR